MLLYVIAVCYNEALQRRPILPGFAKRIAWSFEDPSFITGTYEERLDKTRAVRDKIKDYVVDFVKSTAEHQDNV